MTKLTPQEVELILGRSVWMKCPKCETDQLVVSWKNNPCGYLGNGVECGNKFDVVLTNEEILAELLEKAQWFKQDKYWSVKEPLLQTIHDGTILVHQLGEWKDK